MARLESPFQQELGRDLRTMFPGCVVLKNDPTYLQGVPDLMVIWGNRYAFLECKKAAHAAHQPNQDYYVELFNEWSFAAFIYPENKEEVLNELQQAFSS